jgi:hypothetical protein
VKSGPNLYLTRETLEAMRKRDSDTSRRYRDLRNEVSRLVRMDKQDSNLLSLKKASNDPKVFVAPCGSSAWEKPPVPARVHHRCKRRHGDPHGGGRGDESVLP